MFDKQRIGKIIFLAVCITAITAFLLISNNLVKQLAAQERERMNIWAQATERLTQADINADFDFLLAIIQQNNSIPVMVIDEGKNIREFRNFDLPDKADKGKFAFEELSEENKEFLSRRLRKALGDAPMAVAARTNPHLISVEISPQMAQYIYYEDSIMLRRLSLYPYLQMGVMIVIAMVIYFALVYTKKAEQNRVWVGLSKETAHQLGTPISSLMAWTQYLEELGTDKEIVSEIDKDVNRLSVIAERFSKVGSKPELKLEYLNDTVAHALDYMRSRISAKVKVEMHLSEDEYPVMLSTPLFAWVMENLMKNAVDAMDGKGTLSISTGADRSRVWIEVADTGKGIARKNFKNVFHPGFTTKKRGWGLGLTLVKRIVEEYHRGSIFVKESELGRGTTFRIELPIAGQI